MSDNYSESESENSTYSFNNSRNENDSIKNQIENISVDDMVNIFKDNKPTEEIDEIPPGGDEDEKNEIVTSPKPGEHKTNMFKVSISDGTDDTTQLNKKRGRKSNSEEEKAKEHDKYSPDNIQRKIQVHYQSFIVSSMNDFLESFGFRDKLLHLDYEFKKIVNKKHFDLLINSNIGKIISNQISDKYKKKEKNNNSSLYEYFKTNKVLEKIFNMNYLTFFEMFYMKNERTVDLKIFGIEKVIYLSDKTKTYYDFLEKLKKKNDEKYIRLINECINKNYLKERPVLY